MVQVKVCDLCQAHATASMELSTLIDRNVFLEKFDLCETHYQMMREMVVGQGLQQAVTGEQEKRKPGRPKSKE